MATKSTPVERKTVIVDARRPRAGTNVPPRRSVSPAARNMFTGCRRQGGTGRGMGGRGRGCV